MKPTPADIRNVALLSVATVAAGLIVPGFPFLGMPLAGFALGWIAYRFGPGPSIALALVTGVLVAAFGPVVIGTAPLDALFVTVTLLAAGPLAAWGLRRYPAYNVVALATIAATAAYLLTPIGALTLKETLAMTRQLLDTLAASGQVADPAALKLTVEALLAETSATWVARVGILMGVGMLFAVPLVSRAGRSLGVEASRYPALADTDLSFHIVWPAIAGLALLAAGTFTGDGQGTPYIIGLNILMIVRPVFALQGLSVFAALYRKIGVGRFMRTLGFVLLVLTELLIPSVSVLGLVDLFFNVRRIPRAGTTRSTGAAL